MDRRDYTDRVLSSLRRVTEKEREAIRSELDGHIEDHMEALRELGYDEELAEEREQLSTKKAQWENEKNAIGKVQKLREELEEANAQLEKAQRELAELEGQRDSASDFKKHIDTIRRVLQEAERDAANGLINKEFVEQYIDKIFATPEEDGSLRLQIKIFTGETTDKYLQNLRSRTGHTFKNKYGKNAILKGMNLEEGATAKDRNEQIGGHRA